MNNYNSGNSGNSPSPDSTLSFPPGYSSSHSPEDSANSDNKDFSKKQFREPHEDTYTKGTSFLGVLHRFLVDIVGCLVPGIVAIFGFYLIICFNYDDINNILNINRFFLRYNLFDNMSYGIIVFLLIAYFIGFFFYRRSPSLPDAVSQFLKILNETQNSVASSFLFYLLISALGSFHSLISNYISHTVSQCCFCSGRNKDMRYITITNFVRSSDEIDDIYEKLKIDKSFADKFKKYATQKLSILGRNFLKKNKELFPTKIVPERLITGWVETKRLRLASFSRKMMATTVRKSFLYIILPIMVINLTLFLSSNKGILNQSPYILWSVASIFLFVYIILLFALSPALLEKNNSQAKWNFCLLKKEWEDNPQTENVVNLLPRCKIRKFQITRYPYEDYFEVYLHSRGISWLLSNNSPQWVSDGKGNIKHKIPASKRIIESIKTRIRYFAPDKSNDIVRLEAHIRLASATWYIMRLFSFVCFLLLFFSASSLTLDTFKEITHEYTEKQDTEVKNEDNNKSIAKESPAKELSLKQNEKLSSQEKSGKTTDNISSQSAAKAIAQEELQTSHNEKNSQKDTTISSTKNQNINDKASNFGEFIEEKNYLATIISNLFLFILFSFFSYSSATVIHYLRLKEVHFILETYHLLKLDLSPHKIGNNDYIYRK